MRWEQDMTCPDEPQFPEELIERCAKALQGVRCEDYVWFDDDVVAAVLRESGHAELVAALNALWHEVVMSGNSDAKDHGWPKAKELTLAALRKASAL